MTEDGRECYAENNGYTRDKCSGFVREIVEPLLGRVQGAACSPKELGERLTEWFKGMG